MTYSNIIFRAKISGKNEWIYGDLIHRSNFSFIHITAKTKIMCKNEYYYDEYLVDNATVSCTTFTRDTNRKLIFDGDILQDNDGKKWLVRFRNSAFELTDKNTQIRFSEANIKNMYLQVIGNIFDNHELLNK